MGDDDVPDPAEEPTRPEDRTSTDSLSEREAESVRRPATASNAEAATRAEAEVRKRWASGSAKKRSRRGMGEERYEPYDPSTPDVYRDAEGLPERVIGTMESDKRVIQGFSYPPEPPAEDPDPSTPDRGDTGGPDDPETDFIVSPGYLDRAIEWFRRAPVIGTIILVFGTAVIVVPIVLISLDDEPTQVDPSSIEFVDDETDEPVGSDVDGTVDGNIDDTNAGIHVGTATAMDPCGPEEYDVNMRFTLFNNGEVRGEQLLTPNGNAFDVSEGRALGFILWSLTPNQAWGYTLGDQAKMFNVYSPTETPTPPENLDDLFEGMSDEEFAAAFGMSTDACVVTFSDVMFDYTPFPPPNPVD